MSLSLSNKALSVKPSSTLGITAKVKQLKADGIDVVGFGAGEPDFNTPENICNAAIEAIKSGFTKYTPASGTMELKEAVCNKFKEFNNISYEPSQIVISNGGKHSLTNVFSAIINPGDEVIIQGPYWLSYPEMVKFADGKPVFVYGAKDNHYKVTPSQIEKAITSRTKALILNSPNNPTGMIYTRDELSAIADLAVKHDFYVVSDEMYEQLIYGDEKHVSIASLGEEIYKRTLTCSGISKSYAMTGWRIGYVGAPIQIAKLMGAIQSHATSNPNSIAQKAALEALCGQQDTVNEMREEFNRRRIFMYDTMSKMPYIDLFEPRGAFYAFVDISKVLSLSYKGEQIGDTQNLARILLEDYHVAVIPCADFGYPDHIRLSYAISMEQIKKGLDRITDFLNTL